MLSCPGRYRWGSEPHGMLNENEHARKIGREKKWLLICREKYMYEQAHVESLDAEFTQAELEMVTSCTWLWHPTVHLCQQG